MYLEIFPADFAVFRVFWGISRDFAEIPEFRGSATARNIRSPAFSKTLVNCNNVICLPREQLRVIRNSLNVSVHSRLNWNLEVLVLRRGENLSTRRKTSQSKGENQQQTQCHIWHCHCLPKNLYTSVFSFAVFNLEISQSGSYVPCYVAF